MTLTKDGTILFIDDTPRQISAADTIFCPVCHEEILWWQTEQHYTTAQFEKDTHN